MADIKVKITGDNSDLTSSLKDSETKVNSFGSNLKGLGAKAGAGLALGAAGGVTLLGTAVAGVGIKAFSTATDIESATKQIQAALGVTASEAEKLGAIGTDVFESGFTASIGEATAAVGLTATQLKNISFDELQPATTNALKLADAFGTDITGSLNAANVLMTQFGLGQQEAFDFLSSGFQGGLDTSGDFLDTISEYGNLFGQAGADAGQFFSVMETGLQGGALGLDKSADLFKEFQIRILDMGDDTIDGLKFLMGSEGLNGFYEGLSDGSLSMVDAFASIQSAMTQIDDPIQRNTIGVALMGSQFEDMGANAVAGISTATTSMADLEGSTATLDSQYDTLSVKFDTLGRKATTALAPIGAVLIEGLELALPAMEKLVDFFAVSAVPAITDFAAQFKSAFAGLGGEGEGGIGAELASLKETFTTELGELADNEALSRISEAFSTIGEALGIDPGETMLQMLKNDLANLDEAVASGAEVLDAIATAAELIAAGFVNAAAGVKSFQDYLNGLSVPDALGGISDSLGNAFSMGKSALGFGGGRAAGGPVSAGTAYLVGEEGPELFMPGRNGTIIPNGGPPLGGGSSFQDNGASAAPTVINLMVDGTIIETIVSGRQGVQRQQQAALGGATRL